MCNIIVEDRLTQRAMGFGGDLEEYSAQLGCSEKGMTTLMRTREESAFR